MTNCGNSVCFLQLCLFDTSCLPSDLNLMSNCETTSMLAHTARHAIIKPYAGL